MRERLTGKTVLRSLAVVFFTWVALSMAFTMIPVESVLREKLKPAFYQWRSLSGLEQHWDMFATVPYHRSYEVTLEIEAQGGGWGRLPGAGPVLPGLQEPSSHFRYHTLFTRLDTKRYKAAVSPYMERLEGAILESHPELKGRRFQVRKAAVAIHPLETIRDLGEPGYERTFYHGPEILGERPR